MSKDKDTAVSPDTSEEELSETNQKDLDVPNEREEEVDHQELVSPEELEESGHTKADSPEEATTPDEEGEDLPEKNPPKDIDYVFVNHMMRSARSGLRRHLRAGHRRQGVILDNGQRIRRRGMRMTNQVKLHTFVECHRRLLDYLERGIIEIIDPKTTRAMTEEQVIARIEEVGTQLLPGKKTLKVDWVPSTTEPLLPTIVPEENEESEGEEADSIVDPDAATSAPEPEHPTVVNAIFEELSPEPEADSVVEAEESVVEESSSDDEESEGITEEELLKLTRTKLNDAAREYGVEKPEAYPNKPAVVNAIFEAQAQEED